MSKLADIRNKLNRIERVAHLGPDTFFGRQAIFEDLLQEEHSKTSKAKGMYSYHGMEQYGNIVEWEPAREACRRFVDDYEHEPEFLIRLRDWYDGRGVDCAMLCVCIKYFLKERGIEVEADNGQGN
jgi:hypothetical protein